MKKIASVLLVLFIGTIGVYYFLGNLFPDINHKYFAQGGDGAKDYYTMLYHIKHDSSYLKSGAMNYPFGENIFFSGAQPFMTNAIKFISSNIVNISQYTVAIHNLSILLSLVLCVLFLFLIFRHLKLGYWYSLLIALGITFLSPQIDRMGGHFSLSYTFFIPLALYLVLLYKSSPKLIYSIAISLLFIVAAFTHGYFMAFIAVILLFFWGYLIYQKKGKFSTKEWLDLALQLLLPIILVQIVTIASDNVNDRTGWPWGFLSYRAYPESVFISGGKPYWQWLYSIVKIRNVEWEGIAYVGLISSIAFFVFLFKTIKYLIKKKYSSSIQIVDHKTLNLFYWTAFILLMFSFGLPFIAGLERLLEYLGPIRQFRGIGRFAWLFYYVINIVVFYQLWQFISRKNWNKLWLAIPVTVLMVDAWYNSKSIQYFINNRLPEFDYAYHHDDTSKLNTTYQAIMPIPYFNVGSENYWHEPACPVQLKSYALSLYTGIPLNAVNMSRTSITQCIANFSLALEPYKGYKVLPMYRPDKKILLYVDTTCNGLYESELDLVHQSKYVDTLWGYQIRSLSIEDFNTIIEEHNKKMLQAAEQSNMSVGAYLFFNFDSLQSSQKYMGNGAVQLGNNPVLLYKGLLPGSDTIYKVSFWVYPMDKDLAPRNSFEVALGDKIDNWYKVDYPAYHQYIKTFDGHWGLVELEIKVNNPNDAISIAAMSLKRKSGEVYIDNLLIRPAKSSVKYKDGKQVMINNLAL